VETDLKRNNHQKSLGGGGLFSAVFVFYTIANSGNTPLLIRRDNGQFAAFFAAAHSAPSSIILFYTP
jgi:hypothetical protein